MSITRADVADLREGDFVEVVETCCGDEITTRGPVRRKDDYLNLGDFTLVRKDGEPASWYHTLTVISRAPRPLYVNHPRTEPVPGDVVRDCDGAAWSFDRGEWWCASPEACDDDDPNGFPIECYRPLTLLWDGETGQIVPAVQS